MHEALVLQWRVLRPNATCALSRPHGTRRFRPSRADSPGWRRQSAGRNWPAGSAPAERRLCNRKGDLRLGAREWARCVESRCGAVAVGRTYLLPPLSSGGASLVRPWLRFHIPLIEPDRRIYRTRLSDKTSRLHPRRATTKLG